MFSPFICGSFHHHEDEDEPLQRQGSSSPCSTPRKSSRKNTKNSKNPYSTRGLDKFSALLADLEEKRQQIYSQVGSQDISFVRFVYSNSNDCVPIVVKLKDQSKSDETKDDKQRTAHNAEALDKSLPVETSPAHHELEEKQPRMETDKKTEKRRMLSWNLMLHRLRRPSYYMPVFIVLILLLLAFFGRSVTILCTSIGWYLVPALSSIRPSKKKQLVRRFSEISQRTNQNINGDPMKSPHGRQNSF